MSKMIVLSMLVCMSVILAAAVSSGRSRWEAGTRRLRARLEGARAKDMPGAFDSSRLAGLPLPVQRYLSTVLREGQPLVSAVSVVHDGTFNMGETENNWKAFTSDQRVITDRPGFDWDARIAVLPGLSVHVHDAYVAGEGILHAALARLVKLADLRGTTEVAEGELMRFLAEAAWYPTVLLPGRGVIWDAVDDRSARATLRDGETAVTLLYVFNADGLVDSVRAEARGRTVGKKVVPTPWEALFKDYERRDGMLVPLGGEVAWLLPEGPRAYWRGRIVSITYEY